MNLSPKDVYFVESGQTVLKMDVPYTSGQVAVYLNGEVATLGADYNEIDETTIEFLYQLSPNDVIIIERLDVSALAATVINDTSKRSLYKKYGDVATLMPNQRYVFKMTYGDQTFESTFFSAITPFYSSITTIRTDMGSMADDVDDQRLILLIHNNSILADNIASDDNLALLESEEKTPYVFKQYVRYQTEMDIAMNIYQEQMGKQGTVKKVLGELDITRSSTFTSVDVVTVLQDLREKLKKWEKLLMGTQASTIAAGAVRGGSSTTYPLTTPRRTFSDGTSSSSNSSSGGDS